MAQAGFGSKKNAEKLVDVDQQDLHCQGCGKLLLTIASAKIGEIETKFRAICGFCGDHSRILSVNGKPYLSYPEGLTFLDQDFSGEVIKITVGGI